MRRWELPGIERLTKDQEAALAYSVQDQHLVVGGPGTGKTVVMVMRAIQLQRQKNEHIFLVYNHMLHRASQQLTNEQFESSTWMSWFYKEFRRITGIGVPTPKSYSPDWEKCLHEAGKRSSYPQVNRDSFLLIDEGQDMPPGFYQTLIKFGYQNFFVAADQNQQIWKDQNSSRKDLENALAIDPTEVIELKDNFRNNYGVARLARAFCTGDPVSPPPNLPSPKGSLHIPKLYVFKNHQGVHKRLAEAIVKHFRQDDQRLIGVFSPNNEVRVRYLDALREAADRLVGSSLQVYTYKNKDSKNQEEIEKIRFDRGGIVVLNAQSCKGLEFDTVILADIDEHNIFRGNEDDTKKLFYVMVSRARDKVFMLMRRGDSSIRDILPEDPSILEEKDIG